MTSPQSSLRDRTLGAMFGLAAGDAVGTTLEFRLPGSFTPIVDMVGGGPFRLQAGEWTDDTSMALCLAESLVESRGFDPVDQLERYVRWWRDGHLSSTGTCFDIGNATRSALARFGRTKRPYCGLTDASSAGNGSLMRLAPVPIAFASDPRRAVALAGASSRTTHAAPECIDACRYFAALLVGAIEGRSKEELLEPGFDLGLGLWSERLSCLSPKVAAVADGSFRRKDPPAIRGTGYVVETLEAALWAYARSSSFREGALLAANLGDDADTTAAIYGQIAGATYGLEGIPSEWRERLALRSTIESLGERLLEPGTTVDGAQERRPIPNCYWVAPGLLAGEYPGSSDVGESEHRVAQLLNAGVRTFVDLTEDHELDRYDTMLASQDGVEHRRLSIVDLSVPRSPSEMIAILDAIDEAMAAGRTVYVHCWGGIGRTGTVVGCHLVRRGMSGADALREVSRMWTYVGKIWRRPESPETDEQRAYVRGWAAHDPRR